MTTNSIPRDKNTIRVAAAAIINSNNQMLVVRKKGTSRFMQPGGKIEDHETPQQALVRELQEEIGLNRPYTDFQHHGCFSAPATNEADMTVVAEVFSLLDDVEVSPQAEIETIRWLAIEGIHETPLAQLSAEHIFPLAKQLINKRPQP